MKKKFTIGNREFSIGIGKKKDVDEEPVSFPNLSGEEFSRYIEERIKATGKTEAQIVEETFHDGWLTFMVEEGVGSAKLDASQLFKDEKKDIDEIKEFIRLRDKFAPISACVDYLIDQVLGGGIRAVIDDPEDKTQKEYKEEIEQLIEGIYQDTYTRGLRVILPILVNEAFTKGSAGAEITYEGNKTFWDYAKVSEEKRTIEIEGKATEIVLYDIEEPKWKTDLKGIKRLKIAGDAHTRFDVQRDPKSWEIKYWIVDEGKESKPVTLKNGVIVRKLIGKKVAGTYLHTWQVFWLVLRRKDFSVKGESVIKPVYSLAKLLEKIMNATGEGIHRAGNKKYFIVCGTEQRPWSTPHIRNVLQQLKEASKKNWSTIPMPMGFDVKDIGGEVFDAKEVVNYFLKVIAAGMKVPAKVLGVAVREQKEYSNLDYKLNLLSAIKNQLFEHHIWCKHGPKKTKQGGKTDESQYVPNPMIKLEGLFANPKDELEMYIRMLNPANPLQPAMKLEAEKSMARLFGWDEIIFPSQEEYKKQLEEEKAKAEKEAKAKLEKKQGEPEPQTVERQEKRLKGMTDKHPEKGKARELGETRKPKNAVEESVEESSPVPVRHTIDLNIHVKSSPQEVTIKKGDFSSDSDKELKEKEMQILNIREEIANIDKRIAEKRERYEEEKGKKEKEKLDKEIERIRAERTRLLSETAKIQSEIQEMKKTHEEKRQVMKRIKEKVSGEE